MVVMAILLVIIFVLAVIGAVIVLSGGPVRVPRRAVGGLRPTDHPITPPWSR